VPAPQWSVACRRAISSLAVARVLLRAFQGRRDFFAKLAVQTECPLGGPAWVPADYLSPNRLSELDRIFLFCKNGLDLRHPVLCHKRPMASGLGM
jgi:hypothetical protein